MIILQRFILFVKQKTGKQPLEHVADSAFNTELRKCNINHSAEINEIFIFPNIGIIHMRTS